TAKSDNFASARRSDCGCVGYAKSDSLSESPVILRSLCGGPGSQDMDDEQALLYLGAGDSAQKRQARRVLAERYIEPLIGVLAKFLPASSERESLSEHAAPAALMRLFKKV